MPEAHFLQKAGTIIACRHVPWASLIIPLASRHQLPELAAIRLGMPLHDGQKAGHLRGTAVEIQRGQRPGKAGQVNPPEEDSRGGGRESGTENTF